MNRRFVAALVLVLTGFGFAEADEFQAIITRVKDGRVTYMRVKGFNEERKLEYDEEKTLPTTKNVKVVKPRYDLEARKLVSGDPLEGGLKHDAFKDMGKGKKKGIGVLATLFTDLANKNITQIRVLTLKIKIRDKEAK